MIWPRPAAPRRDNRAVTPFFRAFGGRIRVPSGDAVRMAEKPGLHRTEWKVLSVLMPLVTGAAVFDGLWRIGGPWLAWLGILPVLFAVLQLLAFTLGGKSPSHQWHRWELTLTLWTLWQIFHGGGGGVGWAVLLWSLVLLLNIAGVIGLAWQAMMSRPVFLETRFRWFLAAILHLPAALLVWHWGLPGLAAGLFPLGLLWTCGTFLPNARIFGPMVSRVEGKGALLTIDDGPDPDDTPALLDLLDEHGEKAVFFVIGEKVRRFPDLAREIVRRGHELGNHTMTHPAASFWCAGSTRTRRELAGCSRAIEDATGQKPRWFRAPAGHRNWFTHPVCRELGMEVVAWRRRAYDTVRKDVPGIVKCLTAGVRDGDILLLHEATPIAKEVLGGTLQSLPSVSRSEG